MWRKFEMLCRLAMVIRDVFLNPLQKLNRIQYLQICINQSIVFAVSDLYLQILELLAGGHQRTSILYIL